MTVYVHIEAAILDRRIYWREILVAGHIVVSQEDLIPSFWLIKADPTDAPILDIGKLSDLQFDFANGSSTSIFGCLLETKLNQLV